MSVILGVHSGLLEVLWIFSCFEDEGHRLTLKKHPHFYKRLPTSPEAYGGEFRMDPIETFQHKRISVIVNNSSDAGWVILEIGGEVQVFGVWVLKDAIIFKGSCLQWGFLPL
jgi:hypothetical protein